MSDRKAVDLAADLTNQFAYYFIKDGVEMVSSWGLSDLVLTMDIPGKASNHRQAVLLAFLRVAMTQRIWNRPRYACNYSARISERAITKLWLGASTA